jgi:hypothetical protein
MRRGLIEVATQLLRSLTSGAGRRGDGGTDSSPQRRDRRRSPRKPPAPTVPPARPSDRRRPTAPAGDRIEYSPCLDGDPDPGEVVWTWVPYEEDPSQGKDRPVVVIGRRGDHLLAVPLTSKRHDDEAQVEVGRGPWDHEDRVSYAKVERLLDIDPDAVRREGAILPRARFDAVVEGVRAHS